MGLIKTGIQLVGAYGLLRAGSKAANEYQEKKKSRENKNHHCNCHHHEQYQQPQYQQEYQDTQHGYNQGNTKQGPQGTPPIYSEGYRQMKQYDQRYYASNGR
ncbi:uncharacterized protein BO80DRAFT_266656 [Aspergillus ibericus CBS 121593]|uniref:Uncharacterized protein n=1 Tax=Aspergillus ibericus CBS 121593 TaxID=1448316 RepID=A0A395GIS7_9EURO|nr:hypothetical protein BO80DRAFT_266656 [Aspergillus ibericus CBS 121593]RAK95264.1 hypothetical protein BO80DRAFT_266656 [Aspergillus ibericus CBS 121593]